MAQIPKLESGASAPPPAPAPTAQGPNVGEGATAAPRAPGLDLADIRPLEVAGALQILVAEVRAAMDEALLAALRTPGSAALPPRAPATPVAAHTPEQAAHAVLEALIETLPESVALPSDGTVPPAAEESTPTELPAFPMQAAALLQADPRALAQAFDRVDSAVQSGLQQALGIVGGWQSVAAAAPEAAQAAAQLIANALGEELLSAAWLRPEWALFLPRLARYRRRRSRLRRWLDPDDGRSHPEDDERR